MFRENIALPNTIYGWQFLECAMRSSSSSAAAAVWLFSFTRFVFVYIFYRCYLSLYTTYCECETMSTYLYIYICTMFIAYSCRRLDVWPSGAMDLDVLYIVWWVELPQAVQTTLSPAEYIYAFQIPCMAFRQPHIYGIHAYAHTQKQHITRPTTTKTTKTTNRFLPRQECFGLRQARPKPSLVDALDLLSPFGVRTTWYTPSRSLEYNVCMDMECSVCVCVYTLYS